VREGINNQDQENQAIQEGHKTQIKGETEMERVTYRKRKKWTAKKRRSPRDV
jgi:hypothetical protein